MKMFKGQIELKGSYKLYVEDDWFVVFDEQGNVIYYEYSDGYWVKREYDEKGNVIYYENSNGYWFKREYDEKGNKVFFEDSNGYWEKREYDEQGNRIYWVNSKGVIIDKRPKVTIELTQEQLDKIKESGLL
jgi:hypothetical protein